MFFIYIIYSVPSDKYYVGFSDHPDRRLWEHNNKPFTTYTSKHRPWELRAVFECGPDRAYAMKIEKFIKRQKSRSFIEHLINCIELPASLAQLVRVPFARD